VIALGHCSEMINSNNHLFFKSSLGKLITI